jgi:DNA repair protein RecN (Recombination protein N)
MLALKSVLHASDPVLAYVFDEVDAGVGGRIAEVVGRKLRAASSGRQVICITHLAQVASLADHHLRVFKRKSGGRAVARVERLAWPPRVRELARMIAGERVTPSALAHAEEMLAHARLART